MYHFPDGITASKLSEISDRDKAGISRTVTEMEQKGLIAKQSNHDNFYRAKLILTKKGREVADFVRKKAILAVSMAGDGISDEDRKTFYDCLFLISSNLKKISSGGIPDCEVDEECV